MSTRPTQVGTAVTASANAAVQTSVGTPSGLATGDLLIVAWSSNDGGGRFPNSFTINTAAGGAQDTTWTEWGKAFSSGPSSFYAHIELWARPWTSGDPTTWDYAVTASVTQCVVVSAWRGTAATFFDGSVTISATDAGSTSSLVSTAETPSDANDVLLIGYESDGSSSSYPTLPSGLTTIGTKWITGSNGIRFCYKNLSSTSSTGTFTSNPNNARQGVFTVLLAAKASAAVTFLPFASYYPPILAQ